MVDVTLWEYVKTTTRVLRFGRKASFDAVPWVGAEIDLVKDSGCVSRVIFKENGGIVVIIEDCVDYDGVHEDCYIDEIVEGFDSAGWELISNVERSM